MIVKDQSVATLLTWVLRLFMALMGLVLLMGLLAALAFYMVWAALRWLLTGRKPQVVMVWQQFSAMRQNFQQGGFRRQTPYGGSAPSGRAKPADDQVVDVEARELVENPTRLPPP
jgi:hypothetical protein